MQRRRRNHLLALGIAVTALPLSAQSAIPVRDLSAPLAVSSRHFGGIFSVRSLANGRVLVNDRGSRQLVILDSSLSTAEVLLDSTVGAPGSYGRRAAPLIKYRGDSSLFVNASSGLQVISPAGTVVRSASAPQIVTIRLTSVAGGVDGKGNLVYMASVASREESMGAGRGRLLIWPDSAAIARINLDTRLIDTVARVRLSGGSRTAVVRGADSITRINTTINPLSVPDEWAVLADGSIALVRGRDYHIDWIRPDGTRTSTPQLPFALRRLSDANKKAIVDSARASQDKYLASVAAMSQGSLPKEIRTASFVPLSEMGDYRPAIQEGEVKPDLDNNLWILPSTSAQPGGSAATIYDIVNREGRLTHRVRIPPNHFIVGFGRGGVVFLVGLNREKLVLKRTRVLSSNKS